MSGSPSVLVRGNGIAAACCAHLLSRAGLAVATEEVARPPVPAILLSDPALALVRDVFELPSLFADRPRIDRRVVSWGGTDAVALPHGGAVVSEEQLLGPLPSIQSARKDQPDFTIHTAALPGTPRRFGTRRATATPVELAHGADHATCCVEALADGWLFLIPNPTDRTWLLAIGAPVDQLLGSSRVVAPRLAAVGEGRAGIDTCPRLADPLIAHSEDGTWLACGTAAIAFDPICGDGTAQAIREAILAAAVIVAIAEGGDAAALRAHYAAMLIAAMRRHLMLCAEFYRTGGNSPWWQSELAALAEGHDWCTARLATQPEPRYQLEGYRLVARKVLA